MSGVVIDVDLDTKTAKTEKSVNRVSSGLQGILNKAKMTKAELDKVSAISLNRLDTATSKTSKGLKEIGVSSNKSFKDVDKGSKNSAASVSHVKTAVASLVASLVALKGLSSFNVVADDLTIIQNRLRLVNKDTISLIQNQSRLYKISRDTMSSFSDTADIFTKLKKGLNESGRTDKQFAEMVKTLNLAAQMSGSSIESTRAALVQLGQGISSGTLRGQEFNSMAEQMPYLLHGIAKAAKISVAELRELSAKGTLDPEFIAKSLEKMRKATNDDWSKMNFTAKQGISQFNQSLGYFFGTLNMYMGLSAALSRRFQLMAKSVDNFQKTFTTRIETLRLKIFNFIKAFDMFTAIKITFDFYMNTPVELKHFAMIYKQVAKIKKAINKVKSIQDKVREKTVQSIVLDLKVKDAEARKKSFFDSFRKEKAIVDVQPRSDKSLLKEAKEIEGAMSFFSSFKKGYSDLFTELWRFLSITISNVAKLIPYVTLPVVNAFYKVKMGILDTQWALDTFVNKKLMPARDAIASFSEKLNLFSKGDNRLSRAWSQMFRADGMSDFIAKLKTLNSARLTKPMNDMSYVMKQAAKENSSVFHSSVMALQGMVRSEQTLLTVQQSNFERWGVYVKRNAAALKQVYEDVLFPALRVPVAKIFLTVQEYMRTYYDALYATLSPVAAARYANFFYSMFKSIFSKIFSGISSVFSNALETGIDENKTISLFTKMLSRMFSFVWGFLKTLAIAIYQDVSALFVRLLDVMSKTLVVKLKQVRDTLRGVLAQATDFNISDVNISFNIKDNFKSLLKRISEFASKLSITEKTIKRFADNVCGFFFKIYDKIVGHSYWPDTIDGINDYTKNLDRAKVFLTKFKTHAMAVFSSVAAYVKGLKGGFKEQVIAFKIKLTEVDFVDISAAIGSHIGSLIVAGIMLSLKGMKYKLIGAGYLFSFINDSLNDVFKGISAMSGAAFGRVAGDFAASMLNGFLSMLDLLLAAAPTFWSSFTAGLIGSTSGISHAIYSFLDIFSSKLLQGVAALSIAYALLTKDGVKNLKKMYTALFSEIGGISSMLFAKTVSAGPALFASKRLAMLAVGVFGTAFFDSVSVMQAAYIGVPLMAYAILGADGGRALLLRSIVLVKNILLSIVKTTAKFALGSRFSILENFLLKAMGTSSVAPIVKSKMALMQEHIMIGIRNLRANLSKGNMSLSDAFFTRPGADASAGASFFKANFKRNASLIGADIMATANSAANIRRHKIVLRKATQGMLKSFTTSMTALTTSMSSRLLNFATIISTNVSGFWNIISRAFTAFNVGALLRNPFSMALILTPVIASLGGVANAASTASVAMKAVTVGVSGSMLAITSLGGAFTGIYPMISKTLSAILIGSAQIGSVVAINGSMLLLIKSLYEGVKAAVLFKEAIPNASFWQVLRAGGAGTVSYLVKLFKSLSSWITTVFTGIPSAIKGLSAGLARIFAGFMSASGMSTIMQKAGSLVIASLQSFASAFRGIMLMDIMSAMKASVRGTLQLLGALVSPLLGTLLAVPNLIAAGLTNVPAQIAKVNVAWRAMLVHTTALRAGIGAISGLIGSGFKVAGAGLFTIFEGIAMMLMKAGGALLAPLMAVLKIATGAGVVGIIGLALFGPKGTLVDKLNWIWDKLRSIVGLEAKSQIGRQGEMDKYQSIHVGSRDVNLTAASQTTDFAGMSTSTYKTIKEYTSEVANSLELLNKTAIKQGYLTEAQEESVDTLLTKYASVIGRQKQLDISTEDLSRQYSDSFIGVKNDALTRIRRAHGGTQETPTEAMIPMRFSIGNDVAAAPRGYFEKTMSSLTDISKGVFDTGKAIVIAIAGLSAALLYRATVNRVSTAVTDMAGMAMFTKLAKGGILYKLVSGLVRFIPLLTRLTVVTGLIYIAFKSLAALFPKKVKELTSWTVEASKYIWSELGKIAHKFVYGDERKPTTLQSERKAAFELNYQEFAPALKYLSKDLQDEYRTLVMEAKSANKKYYEVYDDFTSAGYDPNSEIDMREYAKWSSLAWVNAITAADKVTNFMTDQKYSGYKNKGAVETEKTLASLTGALKTKLGVEINPMEFLGNSSDIEAFGGLLKQYDQLTKNKPTTLLEARIQAIKIGNLKTLAKTFQTQIQKEITAIGKIEVIVGVTKMSKSAIMSFLRSNAVAEQGLSYVDKTKGILAQRRNRIDADQPVRMLGKVPVYSAPPRGFAGEAVEFKSADSEMSSNSSYNIKYDLFNKNLDTLNEKIVLFGELVAEDYRRPNGKFSTAEVDASQIRNLQVELLKSMPTLDNEQLSAAFKELDLPITVKQLDYLDNSEMNASIRKQLLLSYEKEYQDRVGVTRKTDPSRNNDASGTSLVEDIEAGKKLFTSIDFMGRSLSETLSMFISFGKDIPANTDTGLLSEQLQNALAISNTKEEMLKLDSKSTDFAKEYLGLSDKLLKATDEEAILQERAAKAEAYRKASATSATKIKASQIDYTGLIEAGNSYEDILKYAERQLDVMYMQDDTADSFKEKLVKQLVLTKDLAKATSTVFDKLSSILSYDSLDLMAFGGGMVKSLSNIGQSFSDALTEGINNGGLSAAVAGSLRAVRRSGEIAIFGLDIAKTMADSVYLGVKKGFDLVKGINARYDYESYLDIAQADRERLVGKAAAITLFDKAQDIDGLSSAVQKVMDEVNYDNVEEKMSKISSIIQAKTIPATKRLIDAIIANTNALLHKVTSEPKPEAGADGAGKAIEVKGVDKLKKVFSVELPKLDQLGVPGVNRATQREGLEKSYTADITDSATGLVTAERKKFDAERAQARKSRESADALYMNAVAEGDKFSASIRNGFNDSLKGLVKGDMNIKEFGNTMLDKMTDSYLDMFMDSMMKPFTGEDSALSKMLFSMGESVTTNIGSMSSGLLEKTTEMFGEDNEGIFNTIGGFFTGIKDTIANSMTDDGLFSKIGGFFTGLISSIKNALFGDGSNIDTGFNWTGIATSVIGGVAGAFSGGASSNTAFMDSGSGNWAGNTGSFSLFDEPLELATGGAVFGAGTNTSDSIPTMLSDGEFVMNAKATSANRNLLEAINSGRIAKFAQGGAVSGISSAPTAIDSKDFRTISAEQGKQEVNISITGDISRQTKAEIYRMLPTITNGVNNQNKEMGYRG